MERLTREGTLLLSCMCQYNSTHKPPWPPVYKRDTGRGFSALGTGNQEAKGLELLAPGWRDLSAFIQAPLVFPSGMSQKSLGKSEFKGKVFSAFSVLFFFGACTAGLRHAFHHKRFMHLLTESL